MHLGILETGRVNEALIDDHGEYPQMFTDLYQDVDPQIRTTTFAVLDGMFPSSPVECDAWLVTGSKFGVYDDEPWIAPLKNFLVAARAARVPMIGICFGHQIMAEAFGGRAEKSSKGWGCGVHRYALDHAPGWLDWDGDGFAMHAMHQDQVTALPEDATCLASSPFCAFAMVSYGDPQAPDAISVQPHPEFGSNYARDLVDLRMDLVGPDVGRAAMASFGAPVQGADFARWSVAYVRQALARVAAA